MEKFRRIKKIYQFYTGEISYKEFDKFVKHDIPQLYDFYARRLKSIDKPKNSFKGFLFLVRNLFVEFLELLTPVRRIIYSTAIILFVLGFFGENWQWAWMSFVALNILLAFELADKLIAKDELVVARDIQTSLMPKEAPLNNFYEICCYTEAAKEVGGDYYDFIYNGNSPGKTFLIIGDISGKGMGAALQMVQVQSMLHHIVDECSSPKGILTELNKDFKKVSRKGSFFTASLASINENGTLHLTRAGHMPIIYYNAKDGKCINIIPKGIGIGLTKDSIFENSLEEVALEHQPGDLILFYTDGIVEAMNSYNQMFGEERLKEILCSSINFSVKEIQDSIISSVNYFKDSHPANDDLTLVILKATNGADNEQH